MAEFWRGEFSPYSRGWSGSRTSLGRRTSNSPRIRGDGPLKAAWGEITEAFSPYSRGWSQSRTRPETSHDILPVFAGMVPVIIDLDLTAGYILPVFAGMVPRSLVATRVPLNSPRIRGDGPISGFRLLTRRKFSPYSRGWSHQGRVG